MLSEEQLKLISEATLRKTAAIGLKHASENKAYLNKSIKDLRNELQSLPPKPSLVISAGPSLHRHKSIETIKDKGFNGHIIAVDGALGHCLRNGVVPDFVITVDPDPHRIIRWFGDPRLAERPVDDYFKRQDLDPAFRENEVARNAEMIELVNRYGSKIKAIISTSVSSEITRRCLEAGMELYWWNPLYDDYDAPESVTRKIRKLNGVPCMVTGGNVGTSAWVFTHTILKSPEVVLVGMDFSYPPGTDVVNTQYYEHLKEIFPDDPSKGLIFINNPHTGETLCTDPAYYWYNINFLNMAPLASCKTYNCSEGGILFGNGVEFRKLSEVLTSML
ncbi:MAG: DUF115 domain-containing protein [Nitrospirae bacterium]|nr:DUF115 domain-containing protein [Nitrospirota bacterium]